MFSTYCKVLKISEPKVPETFPVTCAATCKVLFIFVTLDNDNVIQLCISFRFFKISSSSPSS